MEYSKPNIRCGDWKIMNLFGKNGKGVIGVLIGCTSMLYAAGTDDFRQLDIVIRDFRPSHPDFENFSEEAVLSLDKIYNYNVGGIAMNTQGYSFDWYSKQEQYHKTCGNKESKTGALIGQDGYPKVPNPALPPYLRNTSTAPDLEYGECSNSTVPGIIQRGYKQVQGDVRGFVCQGNATMWANPVYYTPGMVNTYLEFDPPVDGEYDMYDGVHIRKAAELCDNQFFDQWYSDVPDANLRTNMTLDIPRDGSTNYFVFDYNYNNGGYSPLDSIDPNTKEWVGQRECVPDVQVNKRCEQFGPQSFSIFCPPYEYNYAVTQTDYKNNQTFVLCAAWLANGGPKNDAAALATYSTYQSNFENYYNLANTLAVTGKMNQSETVAKNRDKFASSVGYLPKLHLRNYAFTMMGYAKFKYRASNQVPNPEVFEFAGDDDMWIFVDGVLAVDLGGTHLSAPGSVNIQTLAQNNHGCHAGEPLSGYTNCEGASDATGWADNTWHHLHFFYADRQTDGSNILIRTSLAEIAATRYGQPAIASALVTVDENGNQKVSMNLNTPLDENTLNQLKGSGSPAIIIVREEEVNGVPTKVVYGFYIYDVIQGQNEGAAGVQYDFMGELRDLQGNPVPSGIVANDKIAFNYLYSEDLFGNGKVDDNYAMDNLWQQLADWSSLMTFTVMSTSGKGVVGPPNSLDEWAVTQFIPNTKITTFSLDSLIDRPDFTNQSNRLTEIAKNNDGTLPLNATADLQITPIPLDCGLGPGSCGVGGNPLDLKNEFKRDFSAAYVNGTSQIYGSTPTTFVGGQNGGATGLCYGNGDGSNESCVSIAYPVAGPFRLNIRIFDHLGHFVNQYQQVVTIDMLSEALGGAAKTTHPNSCQNPLYGETGAAWITAKVYPVSQTGRLLATGPYIYQVTFVQEDYVPCVMVGSMPQDGTISYSRSNDTYRLGYRRNKKK